MKMTTEELEREGLIWFEQFVKQISRGNYPAICGRGLTEQQIARIGEVLFSTAVARKSEVMCSTAIDYFNNSIMCRRMF